MRDLATALVTVAICVGVLAGALFWWPLLSYSWHWWFG